MGFFLSALWRMYTQRHHYRKWFCTDKPNRIKNGYGGPDGLYPHERSHADQERAGLRKPDEPKKCTAAATATSCKRWGI